MHRSVEQMRHDYCVESGHTGTPRPDAGHFCDNQRDADTCAELALAGKKRATASSLWSYEAAGQSPPSVGDLHIVTDWTGVARCIIRITDIEVVTFKDIDAEHALEEGEGDGSLEWWGQAHWAYYERELSAIGKVPTPDMPIAFERFEVVYPSAQSASDPIP